MGDLNDYTVFRRRSLGYQFNLPKLELKLTEQQLQVNGDDANYWLVPTSFAIREFGEKQILRLIGKYVDPIDRRSYLTQVPAVVNQNSSSLSLYTDNTPDPFSRDNQFGIGVKGFGFGSQGSIFLQGTSDRPGSNLYNSFQFNIVPGEIPLVVLKNVSVTPQLGIDARAHNPSLGAQINFKDFFIKSINVGVNNLSWDWKRKLGADSVQILFDIALPGFI